jgi:hypothetical protein
MRDADVVAVLYDDGLHHRTWRSYAEDFRAGRPQNNYWLVSCQARDSSPSRTGLRMVEWRDDAVLTCIGCIAIEASS